MMQMYILRRGSDTIRSVRWGKFPQSSHRCERLRAEYEFLDWHDRRGSGDPSEVSAPNLIYKHPDLWNSNRARMDYSFGSPGGATRLPRI
jgi:hypothetical protein